MRNRKPLDCRRPDKEGKKPDNKKEFYEKNWRGGQKGGERLCKSREKWLSQKGAERVWYHV